MAAGTLRGSWPRNCASTSSGGGLPPSGRAGERRPAPRGLRTASAGREGDDIVGLNHHAHPSPEIAPGDSVAGGPIDVRSDAGPNDTPIAIVPRNERTALVGRGQPRQPSDAAVIRVQCRRFPGLAHFKAVVAARVETRRPRSGAPASSSHRAPTRCNRSDVGIGPPGRGPRVVRDTLDRSASSTASSGKWLTGVVHRSRRRSERVKDEPGEHGS